MSGPDMGQALKKARPNLRVMLMSGGPNGSLLVLNYGWAHIQKSVCAFEIDSDDQRGSIHEDRSQPGGQEFDRRQDRARD